MILTGAIAFYQQALGFDPGNAGYEQSLMVALITKGEFDKALPYAEKLKAVPEIERVSRIALAVNAVNKERFHPGRNAVETGIAE